ncbi:MAG: hypothetical protein H0U70_03090 [Tatlockia sp.]|nr:hypothetical protein [Tatlockia sp.]
MFDLTDLKMIAEALSAKSIYKKQIRHHLGLGFFLSFIPGTEAFRAREHLLAIIIKYEEQDDSGIIKILSHIFYRTLFIVKTVIMNHKDSSEILSGKKNSNWGINRLNPFYYILHFLQSFEMRDFPTQEFSGVLLMILLCVIGIVVYCLSLILYIATEFLLNALHTLLIEPFLFAYEVFAQQIKNPNMEYVLISTEDYTKVAKIVNALDPENLITNVETSQEITLVVGTERKINRYEKHRNSFFFKRYKDSDLFEQTTKSILEVHTPLQINAFRFFNKFRLPNDILIKIADTLLKIQNQ